MFDSCKPEENKEFGARFHENEHIFGLLNILKLFV